MLKHSTNSLQFIFYVRPLNIIGQSNLFLYYSNAKLLIFQLSTKHFKKNLLFSTSSFNNHYSLRTFPYADHNKKLIFTIHFRIINQLNLYVFGLKIVILIRMINFAVEWRE